MIRPRQVQSGDSGAAAGKRGEQGLSLIHILRLGQYPCVLDIRSKAYAAYGEELIYERHRHRYEFNNDFRQVMDCLLYTSRCV